MVFIRDLLTHSAHPFLLWELSLICAVDPPGRAHDLLVQALQFVLETFATVAVWMMWSLLLGDAVIYSEYTVSTAIIKTCRLIISPNLTLVVLRPFSG